MRTSWVQGQSYEGELVEKAAMGDYGGKQREASVGRVEAITY
jgi:hypothetical protein